VNAGAIEYRHNGSTVFESSYTGSPDFYVDTSFKEGSIEVSALLAGIIDPVVVSEPQPPVTNTPSKGGGGGGGSGLLTLVGLAGLALRARRRSFQIGKSPLLHNFAHS